MHILKICSFHCILLRAISHGISMVIRVAFTIKAEEILHVKDDRHSCEHARKYLAWGPHKLFLWAIIYANSVTSKRNMADEGVRSSSSVEASSSHSTEETIGTVTSSFVSGETSTIYIRFKLGKRKRKQWKPKTHVNHMFVNKHLAHCFLHHYPKFLRQVSYHFWTKIRIFLFNHSAPLPCLKQTLPWSLYISYLFLLSCQFLNRRQLAWANEDAH